MDNLSLQIASGILIAVLLAGCTGPVNSTSVADMPSGYLCRILDSREYITTPAEQRAIYAELDRRDDVCGTNLSVRMR